MKTKSKNLFLVYALVISLGLNSAWRVAAQTFTTLYSFTNGNDGANPYGIPQGVVLSGNTLYGVAAFGGSSGNGTVFAVNISSRGVTNLHSFTTPESVTGTNTDGAGPNGVVLSGNTLYGTTIVGGISGSGTIFRVNIDGSGFTNLHNFTATNASGDNSDGAFTAVGVIISGNTLYGTCPQGGTAGNGTIFAINADGTGFTNLHNFTATNFSTGFNGDGATPQSELLLTGSILYGTTCLGGTSGNGVVFALNTNGGGFTNLHNFSTLSAISNGFNSDGALPFSGLVLSGNTLFGTANIGGNSGSGTVFALTTNGSVFTNLHSFATVNAITGFDSDGAYPIVGVVLSGNSLYGTTPHGGSAGNGTVFSVNISTLSFTNLHNFTKINSFTGINSDGANPQAGLTLSANALYGTAYYGGSSGDGTIFSIALSGISPPLLAIISSGTNVILTWPNNVSGFELQSAPSLALPASWSNVSTAPGVLDGRNTVTNPMNGTRGFFRLNQ